MEKSSQKNSVLQTQRTLPYSAAEIFSAFSNPKRLAKWWGPNDFINTFETFDFVSGGSWQFMMHGPDGNNYPNECAFKEIVAGKKIVIEHISAPRFTLFVTLIANTTGTQILWVQEFEDSDVAEAVRYIAEPGNEQNLDRLHKHLRGDL